MKMRRLNVFFGSRAAIVVFLAGSLIPPIAGGSELRVKAEGRQWRANQVAQNVREVAQNSQNEGLLPLRQRSLYLLDQLFEKAKNFESEALKIRVQGRIADALWSYDQERARQMFETAFSAIDAIGTGNESSSPNAQRGSAQFQLRTELLRLLSSHDHNMAAKLIASVAEPVKDEKPGSPSKAGQSNRGILFLQSALSLLNVNPARAAQMLKLGIDSNVDGQQLLRALMAFREKDDEIANDLFRYGLARVNRDYPDKLLNLSFLASYVFPDFGGWQNAGSSGSAAGAGNQADPGLVREFLGVTERAVVARANLVKTATPSEGSAAHYLIVQALMPYFDRHTPEKSATIRALLKEIAGNVSIETRDTIDAFNSARSFEDLVSRAEKSVGVMKDNFYSQAAVLALQQGDEDNALSIVKRISDDNIRARVESWVPLEAAMSVIAKGDFDKAYKYARDLVNPQQRVLVFIEMGTIFLDKENRPRALEVLHDAEVFAGKLDNGPEKARAMLGLAGLVTRIDIIRGFEVMKSAVEAINRATLTLTPTGILTVGRRPNSPAAINNALGLNTFNFNDGFPALARADFDRALWLAQSIERKEASVLAQLAICRAILAETPKSAGKSLPEGSAETNPGRKPEAAPKKP